jgi:hypothetical protein
MSDIRAVARVPFHRFAAGAIAPGAWEGRGGFPSATL